MEFDFEPAAIAWAMGLAAVLIGCWASNLFGLPGNLLIVVAVAAYAYYQPVPPPLSIGWVTVGITAFLAALGELVEFAAGAAGVTKAGGSRRGALLALAGSIVGGIVGMFVGLPVPIIGPLLGALIFAGLGAMVGAFLGEQWKGRNLDQSWHVGKAAFWARLFGTLAKTMLGAVMVAIALVAMFI